MMSEPKAILIQDVPTPFRTCTLSIQWLRDQGIEVRVGQIIRLEAHGDSCDYHITRIADGNAYGEHDDPFDALRAKILLTTSAPTPSSPATPDEAQRH